MKNIRTGIAFTLASVVSFHAQAGDLAFSGFPLSPLPDDARCLSMGNACTAIGDRGEASGVNPAAAAGASATSMNLQLRYAMLETVYLDQEGLNPEALGAVQGQLYMPIDDNPTDISRVGIVVPIGRWSLGGFYNKPIGFQADASRVTRTHPDLGSTYTSIHEFSADMETLGVTAAYRFSDSWQAGISLLYSTMDMRLNDRWEVDGQFSVPGQAAPFTNAAFADDIDSDDSDTVLQAGVIYRPNDSFSFGLAWRQGEEFELPGRAVETYAQDTVTTDLSTQGAYTLGMPGFWSVGMGWRMADTWLFSAEYVHFEHSVLPQVRTHTLGLGVSAEYLTEPIDDTGSFRFGMEKAFCGDRLSNCWNLRLGVLTESDHDGMSEIEGYDTRFTAGLGFVFGQRDQFSLDMAGLGGDEEILFVVSMSYRLGGND